MFLILEFPNSTAIYLDSLNEIEVQSNAEFSQRLVSLPEMKTKF